MLVTQDRHLLREASTRRSNVLSFAGIIYAPQLKATIGQLVGDLELMARLYEPPDALTEWNTCR